MSEMRDTADAETNPSMPSATKTPRPPQDAAQSDWTNLQERGSLAVLRFVARLYRMFGRRFSYFSLHCITIYYFLTARDLHRFSRDYFAHLTSSPEGLRALGHRPHWRDTYRQIFEFSIAIFDRMCVWMGEATHFQFKWHGDEHLRELVVHRRGGILLGSHLGSFEMLRTLASQHAVVINIVTFTEHAPKINSFSANLDPNCRLHIIPMLPNAMQTGFEIRACLERGELVAMLADRLAPGQRHNSVSIQFLGGTIVLPRGPFEIATLLGVPILMTTGLRVADASYEIFAEPFYDGAKVSRKERPAQIENLAQDYAKRLERYCYRAPYQWYNFMEYWESPSTDAIRSSTAPKKDS